MVITVAGAPATSTVSPGSVMLEVGLSAMLTTMSCPEEMPPRTPPAWLVLNPAGVSSSRCSEPRWVTTPKPAPISTPFTALMPIIAAARSASSRSNTGSPRPGGTPVAATVTRAPIESPASRKFQM